MAKHFCSKKKSYIFNKINKQIFKHIYICLRKKETTTKQAEKFCLPKHGRSAGNKNTELSMVTMLKANHWSIFFSLVFDSEVTFLLLVNLWQNIDKLF